MIITSHHQEAAIVGTPLEEIPIKITEKTMEKVVASFIDMYKNKFQFVIELVSNAWDSHVEAGKHELPIEASLVKEENSYFYIVKDWGVGISPQRMENVYGVLGESTKNATNELIGGFGVGSKSVFAYTSTKIITTVYDKVCYNYLVKREGLGKISYSLLYKIDTDEENNTCIKVPIEEKDFSSLTKVVENKLLYFNNLVFSGSLSHFNHIKITHFKNFCILTSQKETIPSHVILLGQVPYEIDSAFMDYLKDCKYRIYKEIEYYRKSKTVLAIKFGIGELQSTLSRDNIVITEQSKQLFVKRVLEMSLEMENYISETITSIPAKNLEEYGNKSNFSNYKIAGKSITGFINITKLQEEIKIEGFNGKIPHNKINPFELGHACLCKTRRVIGTSGSTRSETFNYYLKDCVLNTYLKAHLESDSKSSLIVTLTIKELRALFSIYKDHKDYLRFFLNNWCKKLSTVTYEKVEIVKKRNTKETKNKFYFVSWENIHSKRKEFHYLNEYGFDKNKLYIYTTDLKQEDKIDFLMDYKRIFQESVYYNKRFNIICCSEKAIPRLKKLPNFEHIDNVVNPNHRIFRKMSSLFTILNENSQFLNSNECMLNIKGKVVKDISNPIFEKELIMLCKTLSTSTKNALLINKEVKCNKTYSNLNQAIIYLKSKEKTTKKINLILRTFNLIDLRYCIRKARIISKLKNF